MPIPGIGPQASSIAGAYDALFWFLLIGCTVIAGIVTIALITFAIRYRRRSDDEVPVQTEGALKLELAWTFVPLVLAIGVFLWSAVLYVRMSRPEDATRDIEIFVTGRQWMWKAQQPSGQWENNELHVPINRPVTLNMTSIDVIHSFGVPAFRLKQDVLPGRYTTLSFTATEPGIYPIYCSEYCGAFHSGMVGRVTAMEPRAYEAWLAGPTNMESPAAAGQRLAQNLGCITCHQDDNRGQGPSWVGLFGRQEQLSDGSTVTVDEAYVRESILFPSRKIVAGYEDRMPTYQGQVDESQLLQLIAFIKSLGGVDQQQPGGSQEMPSTDATPGLEPNPGIGSGAQDEP